MIPDFLAFDVETANSNRSSICSLGYVVVKNRRLIKKSELFICPNSEFDDRNVAIHGISEEDVRFAPSFEESWKLIKDDFQSMPLVAHNMHFDLSCLNAALGEIGIAVNFVNTYCTYQITGKKLDVVAKKLELPLEHHSALSDALVCAYAFDEYINNSTQNNAGLKKNLQIKARLKESGQYHRKIQSKYLKPKEVKHSSSPFTGNKVVITGIFASYSRNEIANILYNLGADIDTNVTKRTAYLIAGKNMGPSKKEKAEKWGVRILSEAQFIDMMNI